MKNMAHQSEHCANYSRYEEARRPEGPYLVYFLRP
jgi:hypothetical protein